MKRILVATDFSTRSDRAVRRAVLLANRFGAALSLVHVVDDDLPPSIVDAERTAAWAVLDEQARSVREIDGLQCEPVLVLGDPFEGIAEAADELDPDLLVIGPHRRQALKDVFIGTTAERTIRASRRPVLMANGVPAGHYRHVLVAVDLSACSADAVRAVAGLGLESVAAVSVVHVYDAPGASLLARASLAEDQVRDYLAGEERRAGVELDGFLHGLGLDPVARILKHDEGSAAHLVDATARKVSADLVVVGTRGRTGIAKLLLGSVAEGVLRAADRDVLAVPPRS